MNRDFGKMAEGLHNDGTTQDQRFPAALDPASFEIEDRTTADYLRILALMAKQLRLDDEHTWRALLPDGVTGQDDAGRDWQAFLTAAERRRDNPPHLALFITFLRLFAHVQGRLNKLSKANLDHYYRRVLGFSQNTALPDHICVFPVLMPGVAVHLLGRGTALNAGADCEGNPLVYSLDHDIAVTQAKVAAVQAISYRKAPSTAAAAPGQTKIQTWWRTAPFSPGKPIAWHPFADEVDGDPQGNDLPRRESPLEEPYGLGIGFAISSPLLFLQGGERAITLEFNEPPNLALRCCFSAAGGWHFLDDIFDGGAGRAINIPATAPPIVAVNSKVHLDALPTHCPALKLYVCPSATEEAYSACAASVEIRAIQVTVRGLNALTLIGPDGPLNPAQPFLPFGPHPMGGANFRFICDEMKTKPATACTLHFDWQERGPHSIGLDELLAPGAHKSATLGGQRLFDAAPPDEDDTVRVTQVADGFLLTLDGKPDPFGHGGYHAKVAKWATENALRISREMALAYHGAGLPGSHPPPPPAAPPAPGLKGFVKKILSFVRKLMPSFFRSSATAPARVPAIEAAPGEDPLSSQPKPPHTPTLKSFVIDYSARQEIPRAETTVPGSVADWRCYHLHPMGLGTGTGTILPRQAAEVLASALLIGIADFTPDHPLNLHFAAVEGSGGPLPQGEDRVSVQWHFLGKGGWQDVSVLAEQEGTLALHQPGILSFRVSSAVVREEPSMHGGLDWIRATARASGTADAACCLRGIAAQAVTATLRLDEARPVPVHLREGTRAPVPGGSVKGLLVPNAAIASVAQPFSSYGGWSAEEERGFYTRVSERLRHRNRAVTPWDYERLVLEAFPEIYQAICVRTGPAQITVVVVPRSDKAGWLDLLQPQVRPALRTNIKAYLSAHASGLARIDVVDPVYEELQVSCKVTFKAGKAPAVFKAVLNEDLKRFLSPWAVENPQESVRCASRIHQSVIQAFVASRDYVDHFTAFKLIQISMIHPNGDVVIEARTTSALHLLVSVPHHDISA